VEAYEQVTQSCLDHVHGLLAEKVYVVVPFGQRIYPVQETFALTRFAVAFADGYFYAASGQVLSNS
jgi:hypothetical protein